jgi:type IV pilus assembly protein PilV
MSKNVPKFKLNLWHQRIPCLNFGHAKSGFTFLEILVALLIISIGLLGLAGLQTQGLQANQSAFLRSKAVQSCEDMLDRMRANRANALNGDYDIALGTDPSNPTYTAMALTDLTEWKDVLSSALPAGNGSVDVNGNVATIEVQWTEASGTQSVTVVTRL